MFKEKEIMTTKEVAEYLHIHPLTVNRYAREGKIPAFRIGTDWRFHKKHIERWIQEKSGYNFSSTKGNKKRLT
ncbi:MAG: DNA-binding protein [Candidatus Omnitrophota bacterium]|nr:MAG: DNA-binding protein [Candidatus Omnitrophota bacterium]